MSPGLHRIVGSGVALLILAVATGAQSRSAPATPPSRPFLIVANQRSGVATIVEIESGRVSHVDLGAKPHEVAISPDGRTALLTVPSRGMLRGREVIVFDLATGTVRRTIDTGGYKDPHGVAFLSDSVALVGTLAGTSVLQVDIQRGRVVRAVDGLPENPYIVKVTSTGRAYVSSPHTGKVSEIDIATNRVLRTIVIPDDPSGIAVSTDGKELYAGVWRQTSGGGIAIYDLEKGIVAARLPATQPRRLTLTSDTKSVVVSDRDHLRVLDRASRQVRSIHIGQNAGGSGVACAADSIRCYVALSEAGEVVEVDIRAGTVLRRFAAQKGVDGLGYVMK